MKKNMISFSKTLVGLFLLIGLPAFLGGCSENIDDSNFVIKTEKTMSDYISEEADLSYIKAIFDRISLGRSENASPLTSVLAAAGNYTVFAPSNEAVMAYLTSKGLTSVDDLSYEEAQLLAYNCIIDNGDDSAYETPDFPLQGSFNIANLNDRQLTCSQDEESDYIINGNAKVITPNIEVTNGYLHIVNSVISLSTNSVAEMIQDAPNMQVMGQLLTRTGWDQYLTDDKDLEYENIEHPETRANLIASDPNRKFAVPQKRYLGFTAFVETDDVFAEKWGINIQKDADNQITNWDDIYPQLLQKAQEAYPNATDTDLTSPNNALNRFVSYHFVKGKMSYNHLVVHFNEYLYKYGADPKNPQTSEYTVEVWDYYPTMGDYPDILKITQVPTGEHEIYLNHVCQYNNEFDGDYSEKEPPVTGYGLNCKVSPDNGEYNNNAQNGFYFPIDNILVKTDEVSNYLGNERIRFDLTTILPEMQSNSIRGSVYTYFPEGYFDAITNESSTTNKTYLTAASVGATGWTDYQGDEFIFAGRFDFILQLPPVPKTGYYEIRMGISQNPNRGMAQLYIGESPYILRPTGLPLDLRQPVDNTNNSALNWQDDVDDVETNVENDKNLRNQGYMKAPKYFHRTDGNGDPDNVARLLPNGKTYCCVRRIVGIQYMEANKSYYMRFKSALDKTDAEFFVDYFEYCPTSVYNGANAEDPW